MTLNQRGRDEVSGFFLLMSTLESVQTLSTVEYTLTNQVSGVRLSERK